MYAPKGLLNAPYKPETSDCPFLLRLRNLCSSYKYRSHARVAFSCSVKHTLSNCFVQCVRRTQLTKDISYPLAQSPVKRTFLYVPDRHYIGDSGIAHQLIVNKEEDLR
jgi:hypothetical protein